MNNVLKHILLIISYIFLLVIMLIAPSSTYSQIKADTLLCEGLKGFESNGKWGFKDATGKVIIKPRFDAVHRFSELSLKRNGNLLSLMVSRKTITQ